jgi:hypothetical protein
VQTVTVDIDTWLSNQYRQSVADLEYLGLGEEGVPTHEQVRAAITPEAALFLGERMLEGVRDTLVIAPNVRDIGLRGTQDEPGLITRFDTIRDRNCEHRTRISEAFLRQFGDRGFFHEYTEQPFPVAVVLQDRMDPRDPNVQANRYREAGLVYPNMKTYNLKSSPSLIRVVARRMS